MKKRKNPAAVALGRLGGKIGGAAKVPKGLSMLSDEDRRAVARKGAEARWGKKPGKKAPGVAKQ